MSRWGERYDAPSRAEAEHDAAVERCDCGQASRGDDHIIDCGSGLGVDSREDRDACGCSDPCCPCDGSKRGHP